MSEPSVELKNIIEAALLVAGQPLTIDKMLTMFPAESLPTREEIRAALEMLEEEYAERVVELKQIDRSWRFQTRDRYAPWVTRLAEERPVRYSRALLETLAIIAYRQPVTRGDIENIRGVSVSTDIIKTLVGREWIRQVGVRNVPGRPALYGTTREFLEHFNLKNLEELPPLSALRDLDVISNELNLRLDLEQTAVSSRDGMTAAGDGSHDGMEEEQESAILSEAKSAERE
ncbi:MAG: SMC-Scp complex subunit ScpB [Gammaproteobacteria bacterium]|nr:SMC-Scp complex subunit ScpB [Gammaproteobacteria bacterium]